VVVRLGVVSQEYDDVAASEEDGAQVFESGTDGDWWVQHNL
jgi:hypothetical protein